MQTFTDKAVAWMNNHKKNNKTTFLYIPLNAPIFTIVPSENFKCKSKLSPHGDFCMDVDDTVTILAAVEALGESDNTLVIFTADNGVSQAKLAPMKAKGHFSSYIRGTKGTLYEGGHRVLL